MSKISMTSECFFEELPRGYYVEFLAQEKNVFHGIIDETDWISKALSFQMVKICDLVDLMTKYADDNLYRSWMVYDENKEEVGRFSAYLDIDGHYSNPDLECAFAAAHWVVNTTLQACHVKEDDVRIVFSGQKGFHVEIRRCGEFSKKIYNVLCADPEFESYFRSKTVPLDEGVMIDKQWNRFGWKKNYIRLHDSTNTTDQDTAPRLCFAMTVKEFRNIQLAGVLQKSERKKNENRA